MARKMLINALHEEEARVAIVEEGKLTELDIEIAGKEETRGNVYKGVVVRVEPGLQAAFIDIGLKKLGFLQMGELHPQWWKWRDDIPEEQRHRRPRIQEVLRRGQELVVQVEKGERDMKGAALTSYLSLPGRYMVLMPGSDSSGVSRKVENDSERKKLKEKAAQLEIPEGIGYIIRTEAAGRTKTELKKDFQALLKLHESILNKATEVKAPALVYQESAVVIRTIRDYFSADIDEILVDSKDVYKDARAFLKRTMPKFEKLVKLHTEKRPIFSRYQIEEQIDLIYEKKVPLKSGGSLVIEPTEALVSIDVNSGKSTGEKGVEDTAFRTNMEAAEEAARQLRLRDLGGLIVIDFIDMRDKKHIQEVEKALKNALKSDKARVTVGRISQFGIMEMSRQRIRQTINEAIHLPCPHCEGRGKIKSVEAMALSFLRKVHAAAAKGTAAEVHGGLPLEVAYYLLNRKKRELAQIEDDYDIQVTVKGKPSFLMNQIELELVRREKPLEQPREKLEKSSPLPQLEYDESEGIEEEAEEAAEQEAAPSEAGADEKKKRKRRRRKKKGEGAGEAAFEEAPALPAAAAEEGAQPVEEAAEPAEEKGDQPKKKRRRKRRGKGGAVETAEAAEAAAEGAPAVEEALEAEVAEEEQAGHPEEEAGEEGKKKKRRRRRRRKGGAAEGETAAAEAAAPEAAPEVEPMAPAAPAEERAAAPPEGEKPAPKRRTRKPKAPAAEAPAPEQVPPAQPEPAPEQAPKAPEAPAVAEKVKKPRAPRRKKETAAEGAPVTTPEPAPAAEAPAEEKPKRRAPRRKKEEQ